MDNRYNQGMSMFVHSSIENWLLRSAHTTLGELSAMRRAPVIPLRRTLSPKKLAFYIRFRRTGDKYRASERGYIPSLWLAVAGTMLTSCPMMLLLTFVIVYGNCYLIDLLTVLPLLVPGVMLCALWWLWVGTHRVITWQEGKEHLVIVFRTRFKESEVVVPLADSEIGVHAVAMFGLRWAWHGWAVVLHLPGDSIVLACVKRLHKAEEYLQTGVPFRHLVPQFDGPRIVADPEPSFVFALSSLASSVSRPSVDHVTAAPIGEP